MLDRMHRWTPWFFAAALLLYLKPYTGIRHDALLYLGQGLNFLHPASFAQDLFFAAGSQADYTLFPRLIAVLLRHSEPGAVFLWLSLVGRCAFYVASWLLLRTFMPQRWAFPALLALLVMPGRYGAFSIFAYAEPFLTPRPFSEALSLLAIALTIRRRLPAAAAALALALVLHPLQAISAAVVAWCWLVIGDRRWLWCITAVLPAFVFAAIGVKPFDGLLLHVDPEWWTVIRAFSSQTLLQGWNPRDWAIVVTDIYLLHLLMGHCGDSAMSRIAKASLSAALIGLALTGVFVDLLRLQLPLALQFWRTLWVAHWVAMAGLPLLVASEWQTEAAPKVRTLLLLAIAALGASLPRIPLPLVALAFIPLHMFWPAMSHSVSHGMRRLLAAVALAAIAGGLVRYVIGSSMVFDMFGGDLSRVRHDVILLGFPALTAALVFAAFVVYRRVNGNWRIATTLSAALLLLATGIQFDSRSQWSRLVESHSADGYVFAGLVRPGATVYWPSVEESPLAPWLVMGRASYFTPGQMAGQMFNRETSILGLKRFTQVEPIQQQFTYCLTLNAMSGDDNACWLGDEGLSHLCTPREDIEPPDYFVVPFRQKNRLSSWTVRTGGNSATIFHLYRCSDFASKEASAHV
ncbi:hypothetical protein GCM10008101_00570 [Lysobacter xinjiangensis]|uniref:EpsG family protein n=1 Tax=Cognatilysobacter xinjiangensis TaxID=546892 RepID=A0ABQ3BPW3_9GAMM|nr:hypothetical protein [Lysobacter xinjiangensis]GGZ51480.1 hypothetical protein GCM10008101_00570 [Lysobacter xinjiangensis]